MTKFWNQSRTNLLSCSPPTQRVGQITGVIGQVIESNLNHVQVGQKVCICNRDHTVKREGEIIGFQNGKTLIIPYESLTGLRESDWVWTDHHSQLHLSSKLIGQVLNAFGQPLNGEIFLPSPSPSHEHLTDNLLQRRLIQTPLFTGIRAIDGLLTLGEGQRMGIFAGSGVGKSTLLGMLAKHVSADVNVIALIGERTREVNHFLKKNLGPEGKKKSVVIVTTGDQSPLLRKRAALTATTIASFFRQKGKRVLFMMDSLTRVAMATREIGLAAGEPPTSKGYPPSTFSFLPQILEQSGLREGKGSVTGIYTVLVEGDDLNEPISDAVRGILDGHICLSRELAAANHYPAIDVLASLSRLMNEVVSQEHEKLAHMARDTLALYAEYKDLIELGVYKTGAEARVDRAIQFQKEIKSFLKQEENEQVSYEDCLSELKQKVGNLHEIQ